MKISFKGLVINHPNVSEETLYEIIQDEYEKETIIDLAKDRLESVSSNNRVDDIEELMELNR